MLSVISNKLKGLTVRFLVVYLVSLFVMLAAFVAFLTELNTQEAYNLIGRTLDVGPGYLNGLVPGETEAPPVVFYIPQDVINDFTPINSVSFHASDVEPFDEMTIIDDGNLGAVTLFLADFPRTFDSGFPHASGSRAYYYTYLSGYDKVLLVASLDKAGVEALATANRNLTYSFFLIPVLMILAAIFGRFVVERTVNPVIILTRAAESISEKNLSERVVVSSGDELGRLAQSFNRMAARLERAFITQKLFVSDAAHELRTPLSSAKTAVSFALCQPDIEEHTQTLLSGVLVRLENMESLINDLLFQARAEGDNTTGQLVVIEEVVTEAAEAFHPLFYERSIRFALNISQASGKSIQGNARQILRLCSNLLDNAAKYTPAGGKVSMELVADDHEAVIRVRDTGTGIAPEHLDHIFDRFYKVAADRNPESGFGLGLSICRSIAIRHGGSIAVESEVAKGSVFTVRLPLTASVPKPKP